MNPCPFCDFEGADMPALVDHVLAEHRHETVAGIGIELSDPNQNSVQLYGQWVTCWCERLFSVNHGVGKLSLAHHWQQRGGLAAHILEIVLFKKGRR